MRALRPAIAALFGAVALAGMLAVGSPALSAPGGDASLAVSPSHGRADATFVAQYRAQLPATTQGSRLACPLVQFAWDGAPLGLPVRSARQGGASCVANLRARPPERDRAPGPHQVGVPGYLGHKAQVAGYTIEGAATPTRAGSPTVNHATGTPQADPADNVLPLPSDPVGPIVAPSASVLAAVGPTAKGGGSAGPWIMIVGSLLVLGGVGVLGTLIFRSRREEPDLGFDPDPGGMYE
jgi:hypothetical protein